EEEPVPPRRLNPVVPRDLETICLRCLAKEPERRYVTAAALADELGCFLEGRAIRTRPPGALQRCRRWCRRNPAVAALAAAVLVLFAAALAFGYYAVRAAARAEAERKAREAIEAARGRAEAADVKAA